MANETQIYVGKLGAQTLYKRLKQLIGRITTYKKVPADEQGHPIESNPDSRTIYLVKDESVVGEDKFFEWIWTAPNIWECIGTTSEPCNSWKQWSEDNGSTGVDNTIYIGSNITLNISSTVALGHDNSATYDNVSEPYESSSNILLGSQNEAIDSKYAFQLGTNNTVDGETNPSTQFPVALNIGNHNEIGHSNNTVNGETVPVKDAEGVNIGKSNYAFGFGINLGQSNRATNAGVSIGESNSSDGSGVSIGRNSASTGCGVALGQNAAAFGSSFAVGYHATATDNSFAIGEGTYAHNGGYAIGQRAIAGQASFCVGFGGTYVQSSPTRQATANNAAICLAVGYNNGAYASDNSIVLSTHHIADTSPNSNNYADDGSIIVGSRNYATSRAVVIGDNNYGTNYARIIGNDNNVPNSSLVFGSNNDSYGGYGVLIGRSNTINGGTTTAYNAAIGLQNTVEAEAFAIGRENVLGGWSFALGVSNMSSSGRNGHATLLGYNNSSIVTYPREYITKKVNGETVQEKCHSFLVGYKNDGKHWNSILIGAENTSKPATVDTPLSNEEKDDGFTTAIGYRNVVGRNYDFAYGYMSTADGGENIAFQHSTAIGYRNIAMIDSTLTGCTANIALIESKLTLNNVYESIKNVIHNTLIHSDFTIANGNTSNNFILHTTGGMGTQNIGIHRNIIMVGSEAHPLNVSAVGATNNIIYGFRTGYNIARSFTDDSGNVSVASNDKIDRNILLNNAYGSFASGFSITDNIISSSELEITASKDFQDNVILSSLAYMTYPTNCVKNVILGKSRLDIRYDAANVNNNFLMYSFLGDSDNGSAIVTGEYTRNNASNYMAQNFLFGTNAYHVGASVSFANPDRTTSPENAYYDSTAHYRNQLTAMLIDCVHVFNFGDNLLKGVDESYVFGAGQNVHSADNVVVYGNSNELSYTSGSIVMGARNNVLGMQKERPSQVTHNVIIGSENNIKAGYANDCNMIFGNNNTIQGHYTVVQKTTSELANLPANTPEYFKPSADCLYPNHNNVWIYSGHYYYFYSNGCLYPQYEVPATGTIVDTTTSTLLSNYNSRTLNEGEWYHPISGSSVRATGAGGTMMYANTVYYHYNSILNRIGESYTGDIGLYNCYNRILGHANNVYDHVMDYTVIGAANSVSCTDYLDPFDYSISNGFIQGNNNTATNGSNIISMGNGNMSVGHNSVAIGSQLISKQWQTVIGKYNKEVNGPNRVVAPFSPNKTYVVNEFVYYDNNYYRCTVAVTTAGAWTGSTNWTVDYPDQESALFVVGNGYSETDGTEWQDETKIHRSNALEVYSDGTVWARKFVSDEPTLSLSNGTGIDISETSTNVVISLDADTANIVSVIKSRPQTGRYVLESNDGVLSWVNVGIV